MAQDAAAEGRPSAIRAWQGLIILMLFYMFAFVDRQIISLLVQPIKRDLGLSDIQIGMLQGLAFAIFFSIGGLSIGWLVDRASRRWIIFVGMVVWSVASASCGLATGFGLLFVARLVVGVGEAALTPSAYSLLHDIFPRERLATAMAIFSSGSTVGAGVAFAAGGTLIGMLPPDGLTLPFLGETASWRVAFLVTGLPGLLLAFLVFAVPEPRRPKVKAESVAGAGMETAFRLIARKPRLFLANLVAFPIFAMCSVCLMAWGPTLFIRKFGLPTHDVGLIFGVLIGVFGVLGNVGGGLVVDNAFRRGMRDAHFRLPLYSVLIAVPLLVGGFLSPSPWASAGLLMFGFAFLTCFGGAAPSALQMISPAHLRGQMSAFYIVLTAVIGTGVGPLAVGFVTDVLLRDEAKLHLSLALVFTVSCALAAVAIAGALKPLRAALGEGEATDDLPPQAVVAQPAGPRAG